MRISIVLLVLVASCFAQASCESKLRSRVARELGEAGKGISPNAIKVTHREKMEIEQGAYIRELDRFDVEVLEGSLQKFTGLTTIDGVGCRVESVQALRSLKI